MLPDQLQGADNIQFLYVQVQQEASSTDAEALEQLPRMVLQPLANKYSQMVRILRPQSSHQELFPLLCHYALLQLNLNPAIEVSLADGGRSRLVSVYQRSSHIADENVA